MFLLTENKYVCHFAHAVMTYSLALPCVLPEPNGAAIRVGASGNDGHGKSQNLQEESM